MAALLDQLATEFAPLPGARMNLRLPGCAAVVHNDWVLLGRCCATFVNAIPTTRHGGLLLGCRRIDGGVRDGVWDQGDEDIEPEKLPTIFGGVRAPFEHSSMLQQRHGPGPKHRPSTSARCNTGCMLRSGIPAGGSCFTIDIPDQRQQQCRLTPARRRSPAPTTRRKPATPLLLIGNDQPFWKAWSPCWRDWDYQTLAAQQRRGPTLLDAPA